MERMVAKRQANCDRELTYRVDSVVSPVCVGPYRRFGFVVDSVHHPALVCVAPLDPDDRSLGQFFRAAAGRNGPEGNSPRNATELVARQFIGRRRLGICGGNPLDHARRSYGLGWVCLVAASGSQIPAPTSVGLFEAKNQSGNGQLHIQLCYQTR